MTLQLDHVYSQLGEGVKSHQYVYIFRIFFDCDKNSIVISGNFVLSFDSGYLNYLSLKVKASSLFMYFFALAFDENNEPTFSGE